MADGQIPKKPEARPIRYPGGTSKTAEANLAKKVAVIRSWGWVLKLTGV